MKVGALLVGSVLAVGVSGISSLSPANAKPLSLLQQGLNFYRGKTITYIVPGGPGGSPDSLSRLMAPNLGAYLHATVNVVDITISNQAQDTVANAAPNGLTAGLLNLGPAAIDQLTNTPALNFNPEREQFIGSPSPNTDVYIVAENSPVKTWAQIVGSPTTITELGIANGFTTTINVLANLAFGIKGNVITGYSNEGALTAGFLRGDGEMILGPTSALGPFITSGKAIPVALNIPLPPGSVYAQALAGVPTTNQLLKRFPPKTKMEKLAAQVLQDMGPLGAFATVVPTKTPIARTAALRAAMKWAQARPAATAQAVALGLGTGYESGTQVKQRYINLLTITKPLAATLVKLTS